VTTQYVTAAEVAAALNAPYDSVNHVYTVYGLTISETSFQAHVDFANTYINSLINRDLTEDDQCFKIAKMAALDLACIRILVVSAGGALIGAFDYFLGDLRVSRAGPYSEAIERAIKGFQENLARQLTNLVSSALAAESLAKNEVPTYKGELINP